MAREFFAKREINNQKLYKVHQKSDKRRLPSKQTPIMNPVQRAAKVLELIESIRHEAWQYIVTLGDS
jgi:hypothetical protein